MIYLIKSNNFYKVGYTNNLQKRLKSYNTDNPNIEIISICKTYKKTKHTLECLVHKEIIANGYKFHNGTEWFRVPRNQQKTFNTNGLKMFKCCKNRKVYNFTS